MVNYKIDKMIKADTKLIPFADCVNKDLYEMYKDIPSQETGSINKLNSVGYEEFEKICQFMIDEENIINPQINTTTKRYILLVKNNPIGEVGIRTTLNDFWINKGSQIYYKIKNLKEEKGTVILF